MPKLIAKPMDFHSLKFLGRRLQVRTLIQIFYLEGPTYIGKSKQTFYGLRF